MTGTDKASPDEIALFREAVRSVNRRHRNYRQDRHVPEPAARPVPCAPEAPPGRGELRFERAPSQPGVMLDTTDGSQGETVAFARGGVRKNIVRKLKRGEYRPAATLDLHGHSASQAERALSRFLPRAFAAGQIALLVVHGKGLRSGQSGGVLKTVTHRYLKQQPAVQAFCSALPRDGGSGAVYVLLRGARRRP